MLKRAQRLAVSGERQDKTTVVAANCWQDRLSRIQRAVRKSRAEGLTHLGIAAPARGDGAKLVLALQWAPKGRMGEEVGDDERPDNFQVITALARALACSRNCYLAATACIAGTGTTRRHWCPGMGVQ